MLNWLQGCSIGSPADYSATLPLHTELHSATVRYYNRAGLLCSNIFHFFYCFSKIIFLYFANYRNVEVIMRSLTKLFKALTDSNRLRILKMLEVKPLCVCEITEALHLATSTVSKHLSILRDAGFIIDKKDGKWVNYTLQPENKAAILLPIISEWLESNETIINDTEQLQTINRSTLCGL